MVVFINNSFFYKGVAKLNETACHAGNSCAGNDRILHDSKSVSNEDFLGVGPTSCLNVEIHLAILTLDGTLCDGIKDFMAQRVDQELCIGDKFFQHGLIILRNGGTGRNGAVDDYRTASSLSHRVELVLKIFYMRLIEQIILADDDDAIAPVFLIGQMLFQTGQNFFCLTNIDGVDVGFVFAKQKVYACIFGILTFRKLS